MSNKTVFRRYEGNPIITPESLPEANSIFNSAVIPFGDGYVGVFRVDTISIASELHVGWSKDGIKWDIEPERINIHWDNSDIIATRMDYDPRITKIEGIYYIAWCSSYHGPTIGLAETKDFKRFRQICNAVPPYNRNGVLFPKKINGMYAMLHRPSNIGHTPFGDIFYSTSPDFIYWGKHRYVFGAEDGWQSTKVGAGPPPFETDEGWLLIYHGVQTTCSGLIYRVGGALLDLEKPWKVIYRTKKYLMSPIENYERIGDVPNVVFPTAIILDKKTGQLAMYYGCADTSMGLAYAQLDEVINFIKKNSL